MRILLTNDDGIYSSGLKAAYEALSEIADVTVVAPITQMSAVGRSISIMRPVRISKVDIDDIKIFAVDGTPTDCVVLGIYKVIRDVPDLTVCGINLGENLSTEAITTSGTVCAALEAATRGSVAIAISLELPDVNKFVLNCNYDFGFAKKVLKWVVKKVKIGLPSGIDLLNVNVPTKPNGKVKVTKLAKRMYKINIEERIDPRGREYYWIQGTKVTNAEDGTDIHALRKGYVSITPLSIDLTSKNLDEIAKLLEGRIGSNDARSSR